MQLGEETKGLGEGEAEIGLLAGDLIAYRLAKAPPPVGQLELDRRQSITQSHEVGDPSVERDLGVNLHPLPLQEPRDDGTEVRFLHGVGGEEEGFSSFRWGEAENTVRSLAGPMRPRVFVTRRIPRPGLELLERATDLRVFEEDRMPTREEIRAGLEGRRGLLSLLTDTIDGPLMDAGDLRVISNYAVGVDNIDVPAATQRGILVTNAPVAGLRESPADHTFALLLALSRRIVEGDRMMREGDFPGWGP